MGVGMAEMIVTTPDTKKIVEDYDILLTSGMLMPITINLDAGDTIVFSDQVIKIHLVSKPSMNDPTKMLSAQEITIFTAHVISIQHMTREVIGLTPAEQFEWNKTMHETSGTVQ